MTKRLFQVVGGRECPEGGANEIVVGLALLMHYHRDVDDMHPAPLTIELLTCLSESAVERALKNLVTWGVFRKTRRKDRRGADISSQYSIGPLLRERPPRGIRAITTVKLDVRASRPKKRRSKDSREVRALRAVVTHSPHLPDDCKEFDGSQLVIRIAEQDIIDAHGRNSGTANEPSAYSPKPVPWLNAQEGEEP